MNLIISYNTEVAFFGFENENHGDDCDLDTIEGLVVQTYIDKNGVNVTWIDEGGFWGSKDENGTFNGVVGRVGYGNADVGVGIISYTSVRNELVDYSHAIGVDAMSWISKPPGKLPSSTNIVRTFDYYSWMMIGASLMSVRLGVSIVS